MYTLFTQKYISVSLLFIYSFSYSYLNAQTDTTSKSLKEVEVRATEATKRISNTEVSVHKISVATVKKMPVVMGESDILKMIQLLPGVSSVGDGSVGFNVRGGAADQNLILLDNAQLYSAAHALGIFSVFNSDAISDFKLYKGGIPPEFGGRLASVLDVSHTTGSRQQWEGNGSIGIIASHASAQGPFYKPKHKDTANNSFFIAARRTYADIFLPLYKAEPVVASSRIYFYDLNAKFFWQVGKKDELSFSGYFGRDFFRFSDLMATAWGNALGSLQWKHNYNPRLQSTLSATFSDYRFTFDGNQSGLNVVWNSSIRNYNVKGKWNYIAHQNLTLKAGFESNYYDLWPGSAIASLVDSVTKEKTPIMEVKLHRKYAMENALFVSAVHTIHPKLKVEYGLRFVNYLRLGADTVWDYVGGNPISYNAQTQTYSPAEFASTYKAYKQGEIMSSNYFIEPRFNAAFILDPSQSIKASYNRMHQFMQLVTNTATPLPVNYYMLSYPHIPVQKVDQVSLGYFKNFGENNNYEFTSEVYYKWMNNMVDYIDGADFLFENYMERQLLITKGYSYGVEFMLSKQLGNLTGWLTYTYSRSLRQTDPRQIGSGIVDKRPYSAPFDIPHIFNAVAMYDITKRWSVSAIFVFKSGMPTTLPAGQYLAFDKLVPYYVSRNDSRIKPYHRLDISATLHGKPHKHWQSKWVFSIFNVYNRLNPVSIFFNRGKSYEIGYYQLVPSVSFEFHIK